MPQTLIVLIEYTPCAFDGLSAKASNSLLRPLHLPSQGAFTARLYRSECIRPYQALAIEHIEVTPKARFDMIVKFDLEPFVFRAARMCKQFSCPVFVARPVSDE